MENNAYISVATLDVSRNLQTHLCTSLGLCSMSPIENAASNSSFSVFQNALEVGEQYWGRAIDSSL